MAITKRKEFRSTLERLVHNIFKTNEIKVEYEKEVLPFVQPAKKRRYKVDFSVDQYPDMVLEVKGRFTSQDREKMLLIQEQYPSRKVVMLFGKAQNKLNKASKTTYASWCDDHGILWVDLKDFEREPIECLSSLAQRKAGTSTSQPKKKQKRFTKSAR